MQLPDEALVYQYQGSLVPACQEWGPAAELRTRHFLPPARLRALLPQLLQVRSQVAAERTLPQVPVELQPLEAGFIDLPQQTLEQCRRKGSASDLARILSIAARLREQVDRVVLVGIGGAYVGARALFEALRSSHHNELKPETRQRVPRLYFAGNHFDNDALQELLELLQTTCVDPELREERWGLIVISRSGDTLETSVAYRLLRHEAAEAYGTRSPRLRQLIVPVTGTDGKLRELAKAEGDADPDILTMPANVGGRYSVFTAAGLLPAAVMGLDVRALLLGAQAMTQRFLEEPFERNPVLQYAAVNYLMAEEIGLPIRVLAVWSAKLEGLGRWYDQLLAESLGKQGRGPTPVTAVATRDLHARGQQHQEGRRDKMINNLVLRAPRTAPLTIGMAAHNEDGLNAFARKSLPDLLEAALQAVSRAAFEAARPTADIVLPVLSEHTMGQLMQMLMLATVVEGRLLGVNPYGQPAIEVYKQDLQAALGS